MRPLAEGVIHLARAWLRAHHAAFRNPGRHWWLGLAIAASVLAWGLLG